ncbi:SRPBCC family protein [Pseudonocardia sp. NPDC049635]|uniref:SRPBCC family protein n=1 Tax=Pseudonocardia sp. NPDC049635 TaxID=3155506 RepID=UPI0033DDF946
MATATLSAIIEAPAERIRGVLLSAPLLPEWNPAFVRVEGPARAAAGTDYQLQVIRGLRGTLTYTHVDSEEITMSWRVSGLSETGQWQLSPHPTRHQTRVTHTVERHGALAVVLGHALGTLPRLRLERLAERAAAPQPADSPFPHRRSTGITGHQRSGSAGTETTS